MILVDTGPLYAFFNKRDQWNWWVGKSLGEFEPPLYTCESVISETIFLFQRTSIQVEELMELIERGHLIIEPAFKSKKDRERIQEVLINYQNVPASFADACLVRMAENNDLSEIMTLDSDFTIYRKSGGEPLNLIYPF
ncbi:PIN domain-containing protein [soil metagenome]